MQAKGFTAKASFSGIKDMFSGNDNVYSIKWLKTLLIKKYGDHLCFAGQDGKADLICFRDMASYIINDKWYTEKKNNIKDETNRLIVAVAKLIMSDIRQSKYVTETYPTEKDIHENRLEYLPNSLQLLMKSLITSELKQASIGQCLLKAVKPNSTIPPLLFGLSVELDNIFGSKWLIEELCKFGFCLSYKEVTKYKQSVVQNTSPNDILSSTLKGNFTQFVADNIDDRMSESVRGMTESVRTLWIYSMHKCAAVHNTMTTIT